MLALNWSWLIIAKSQMSTLVIWALPIWRLISMGFGLRMWVKKLGRMFQWVW